MSRIVIALGGNALGDNAAEQREKIREACPSLIGLIAQGHEIIVSHGNGDVYKRQGKERVRYPYPRRQRQKNRPHQPYGKRAGSVSEA